MALDIDLNRYYICCVGFHGMRFGIIQPAAAPLVDLEPLSSECNRISFLCCYSHAYGDSRGGGARRALKAYSWLWDCSLSTKLTQTQTVKGTRVTARKYYYTNTWGLLFMHQYFSDVSLHSYVPYLRSHSISTTP